MRDHYDLASMDGKKNPYLHDLTESVTIRLDNATIAYFKALGEEMGLSYQHLINLCLRDCSQCRRKPVVTRTPRQRS